MQTRPTCLDMWATTSLTQHQSQVSCLIESPFIPSVRGQLSTVTWMFPKIEVPQNGWFINGKPFLFNGMIWGVKPTIFGNTHMPTELEKGFKKMPSDGITLTLQPWKVVSCGSLLTLLPLDIWKGFKTQKNTQVLQIEHHFVFIWSHLSTKSLLISIHCVMLYRFYPANRYYIPLPVHFHKSSSDQQRYLHQLSKQPWAPLEEEWRIWQILWREGILKVFFPSSDDGHWQRWSFCCFVSFWGTKWATNVQRKK